MHQRWASSQSVCCAEQCFLVSDFQVSDLQLLDFYIMKNTELLDIYWLLMGALDTGWLSIEIEKEIQEICRRKSTLYDREIKIMDELRQAVQNGRVKREALEILSTGQKSRVSGFLSCTEV
jgi:hypothetical protein